MGVNSGLGGVKPFQLQLIQVCPEVWFFIKNLIFYFLKSRAIILMYTAGFLTRNNRIVGLYFRSGQLYDYEKKM